MGKAEIDMRIKTLEAILEKYVSVSEQSDRKDNQYEDTLERIRMQLAILYAERESFKH